MELTKQIHKLLLEEDEIDWNAPASQFPSMDIFKLKTSARWRWDDKQKSKASSIVLIDNNTVAKRDISGNNPAVISSHPLTRNSFYFCVRIVRLGSWIGIGIADSFFQVNGSKTLGQQTNGVNSSYFWQGNCRKLQMFSTLR